MKRDMELIKQVLKYVERNAPGTRGFVIQPERHSPMSRLNITLPFATKLAL